MKSSTKKTYGVIIIGLIVALVIITAVLVGKKVLAARAASDKEAETTEYSTDNTGTVNETTEVVTLAETSGEPVNAAVLDEEEQEWIENMTFNLDTVEEGVIPYLEGLGFTISEDGLSYSVPTNKDGFPYYNDQRVRAARELGLYNGVISDAPGWPLVFSKDEWSEKDWEEKVWRRIKYRGITKIEDTIAAAEMLADAPSISGSITFKEIPGNEWIVDFINDSAAARELPLDEHPRGLEIWTATGRDGKCYNNEEYLVRAVAVWQAWDTYLRSSKVDYTTPIVNWRGLAENSIASNTHLVKADYLEKNRPFIVLYKYDKNGKIYDKVGWNLLDGGCARFSIATQSRSSRSTTTTTTTTTTTQQQTTTNTDTSTSTDITPDDNDPDNPDDKQGTKNPNEDPVKQGNANTGGGYNDDKGLGPDHGDQGNSQSSTVQGSQFQPNEQQHDDTSKDTAEATQAAKDAEQQAAATNGANVDDQNPNRDAGTNVSDKVTIPTHSDSHDDNSNTSGNDAGNASVNNDTGWSMD